MATKDKNTFSVYEDSIKNTAPQQDVTISEIYDYVISEDAKASTKELRTIADKDKARVFKSKNFGYATFSGSFTERKEEALKSYSNLICIDIDDTKDPLTIKKTLSDDERLKPVLVFISPSGKGVKAVYRVTSGADKHKEAYEYIASKVETRTGLTVDRATSSIASACYLCWDEDAYFNEGADPISIPIKKLTSKSLLKTNPYSTEEDLSKVKILVDYIEKKRLNITDQFDDWIKAGLSLSSLGEEGRCFFHRVSSISSKYNKEECDQQFDTLLNERKGHVQLGTFYHMLQEANVPIAELLAPLNKLKINIPNPDEFWNDVRQNDQKNRVHKLSENEDHDLVKWIMDRYSVPHSTLINYNVGFEKSVLKNQDKAVALFVPYQFGIRKYYLNNDTLEYEDVKGSVAFDSFFGLEHTALKRKAYMVNNPFDAMYLSQNREFDVFSTLDASLTSLSKRQKATLNEKGRYWESIIVLQDADYGKEEIKQRRYLRQVADSLKKDTEVYWLNPIHQKLEKDSPVNKLIENPEDDEKKLHQISEFVWNSTTQDYKFWYTTKAKKPKLVIDEESMPRVLAKKGFVKHYFSEDQPTLVRDKENILEITGSHKLVDSIREEIIQKLSKYVDVSSPEGGSRLMSRKELVRVFNQYREKALSDSIMAIFDKRHISMLKETEGVSYLYFKNTAVRVTPSSVEQVPYSNLEGKIWKTQILERSFMTSKTTRKGDFETFIENVAGKDNRRIKAFKSALGYLLHAYKDKANSRAVVLVDENSRPGLAQGGTGKGIFASSIKHLRKQRYISGKNVKTDSRFIFMDVEWGDQSLFFDDVKGDFDFESLFNVITDDMQIEAKYKNRFTIPFEYSPKIVLSTNYAIRGIGNSFDRRQFTLPFSGHYNRNWTPIKEFGHKLFQGWNKTQWHQFDQFMISCLQAYLRDGLTFHSSSTYKDRVFKDNTSESFFTWAEDNLEIGVEYKANVLFDGKDKTQDAATPPKVNPTNRKGIEFKPYLETFHDISESEFKTFLSWIREYASHKGWTYRDHKSYGYTVFSFYGK